MENIEKETVTELSICKQIVMLLIEKKYQFGINNGMAEDLNSKITALLQSTKVTDLKSDIETKLNSKIPKELWDEVLRHLNRTKIIVLTGINNNYVIKLSISTRIALQSIEAIDGVIDFNKLDYVYGFTRPPIDE